MMVACATGYKPGVFTHFVANEQIYDRHMDNANEMLARASTVRREHGEQLSDDDKDNDALPAIVLHKEKGCLFEEFTIDDFEVVNYNPMKPQLKFEMGI